MQLPGLSWSGYWRRAPSCLLVVLLATLAVASEVQAQGSRRIAGSVVDAADSARLEGRAVFAVRADGKELFRSAPRSSDEDPLDLDLAITGAERLTLVVEGAGSADVDFASWLDARVLTAAAAERGASDP